jgi:hypothetical protein
MGSGGGGRLGRGVLLVLRRGAEDDVVVVAMRGREVMSCVLSVVGRCVGFDGGCMGLGGGCEGLGGG